MTSGRPFVLTEPQARLEATYADALVRAGWPVDTSWRWGCRAFCAHFGEPEAWHALSLAEQLGLNRKIQRFVHWLFATQRLRASADYLVVGRRQWGPLFERLHPAIYASFASAAAEIGFSQTSIHSQWTGLAVVCAFSGVSPLDVRHTHIDPARTELVQAATR
jgi:hypothetical protein